MRSRILATLILIGMFALVCSTTQAQDPYGYPSRTAMVQLFSWKWTDIAQECENYLGPKGFAAVQVSPPTEHVVLSAQGYPWWQRYQTVSYSIDNSRSGTRAEFADMVSRCADEGVSIYVDAVINHTTGPVPSGQTLYGSDGTGYGEFFSSGLYSSQDFHQYFQPGCAADNSIIDFGNSWQVRNCELLNLYDLKTESSYVRGKIADYLNDLISLGVEGFRIDAAKHIPPADLAAIQGGLDQTASGSDPYIYQEVYGDGTIPESDYFGVGDVTEFTYGEEIADVFRNGKLSWLSNFGESWGLISGPFAIAFVDNHDTQRSGALSYKEGQTYNLANAFMLAWPYGYARVMSSYHFSNNDQGPPSPGSGATSSVYNGDGSMNCNSSDWVCEHRNDWMGNMVAFRNWTVGEAVTNWWDNGNNRIAFSRGDKGFIVINKEGSDLNQWFYTNVPAGEYCDAVTGGLQSDGSCAGRSVVVNIDKWARIKTFYNNATAIHAGSKRPVDAGKPRVHFQCDNGQTQWGENVYVVGSIAALGSWNTNNARLLNPDHWPYWQTVLDDLPANTYLEWKCIIKDGSGNVISWEPGSNNSLTTPSNGSMSSTYGSW